ncbi:MAG: DUF4433 domain-containing protein [Candidatus Schekmanbacteria bacterium]|nr:DUF4433 domain-containing protein [Candidatus Schekmanbacteria bacterium]
MSVPLPTPVYRFLHVDNLPVCLARAALHAPNHVPQDGHGYKTIHNVDIQQQRRTRTVACGPGGVIHDYVPFYFGPRSPMLFQLHTGRVAGYTEGQAPLIYLVSTAQQVQANGVGFVFSDGHGIAAFTSWFDNLADLDKVDWGAVAAQYWADTVDDMDRQRRKQAEFLVHRACDWRLIQEIGVLNGTVKARVEGILAGYPAPLGRPVNVHPEWYY